MKGYKASYNRICKGKTYKVGQTYKHRGIIIPCKSGFHFCQNFDDVFEYHKNTPETIIFEIDSLDGEIIHEGDKTVTSKIKIIREIPKSEWSNHSKTSTYDEKGNQLTYKDSNGNSWESTYDDKGNQLTFKDSDGYSWERTYDEKGNKLTFKNSDGYSWEMTYDEKGNKLTFKDSNGNSWERFKPSKNVSILEREFD